MEGDGPEEKILFLEKLAKKLEAKNEEQQKVITQLRKDISTLMDEKANLMEEIKSHTVGPLKSKAVTFNGKPFSYWFNIEESFYLLKCWQEETKEWLEEIKKGLEERIEK